MSWIAQYIDKNQYTVDYQTELAVIELNEKIVARMAEKKISRVELAKRLGVSKAFVTKLLNGNPNMTIKTINGLALALDCQLYLDLYPKGFRLAKKPWFIYDNGKFTAEVAPAADEVSYACAA